METSFVLCFIFSIAANSQQSALANNNAVYPHTADKKINNSLSEESVEGDNDILPCKANGIVNFVDSSSQPLWLYYWYAEDVTNATHECQIRRFWKQLDAGNNQFAIPENKTLIFRICTSTECSNSVIKQFGIVNYCNADGGVVIVD